jgi:hypothetical protein
MLGSECGVQAIFWIDVARLVGHARFQNFARAIMLAQAIPGDMKIIGAQATDSKAVPDGALGVSLPLCRLFLRS